MKRFSFFLLTLIIPILLIAVGYVLVRGGDVVSLDIWGVATDETQMALERTLLDVQRQFGPRVSIAMHYVAEKQEDGSLKSFQAGRLDGIATTEELQAFDLEEGKRRLVLQKFFTEQFFPYLELQSRGQFRVAWEEVVRSLGIKSEKISALVETKGETLLRADSEQLAKFKEATPDIVTLLPILFIDGQRYEGAADFYSLSAAIARRLLRGTKESLGETGGSVAGIRECYADLHCDDKPTMDGACVDAGKETARCVYTTPLAIHVTILTPEGYKETQDQGRVTLQRQFKGLTVSEIRRESDEGKVIEQRIEQILSEALRFAPPAAGLAQGKGKKEKKRELPEGISLYVLSRSLEQSSFFQQLVESGAVLTVKDVGYLVNPFNRPESTNTPE